MDESMENVLKEDLGEDGFELVRRMLSVMDRGNRNDVRSELRRMVEDEADAERVQADQD